MSLEPKSRPPLVSFILTSWNRYQEVNETLCNLRKQCYPHYEIILVDNCSNDQTPQRIPVDFPEVRYIRLEENRGSWIGRNIAMKNAHGKYIVSLDDDSFPGENSVARAVKELEADSSLGIIAMEIYDYDTYFHGRDELTLPVDRVGVTTDAFIACGAIFRRQLLYEVGMWENWFGGGIEVSFSIRTLQAGYEIRQFKDIYVYHRMTEKSRPSDLRMKHWTTNIFSLYWTYHSFYENVCWTLEMLSRGLLVDLLRGDFLYLKGFFRAARKGRPKRYYIDREHRLRVRMFMVATGKTVESEDASAELQQQKIQRIVLLRTKPMQKLPQMVARARKLFPEATLVLLTHKTTSTLFNELPELHSILFFADAGVFRYSGLSQEQRHLLNNYDLLIFGSNEEKLIGGNENIQHMAIRLDIPRLAGLHIESGKLIRYERKDYYTIRFYRYFSWLILPLLLLTAAPLFWRKNPKYFFDSYGN